MQSVGDAKPMAQRLYIRLLNRKGDVFRLSKLKYPEIDSLKEAASELHTFGLVSNNPLESATTLISLYTKPELVRLFEVDHLKQAKRAELVTHLESLDSSLILDTLQKEDIYLSTQQKHIYRVFCMCFFGNAYQDPSEFVLRDLGLNRYESYIIDSKSRVFHSRPQLDAHLDYVACVEHLDSLDLSDVDAIVEFEKTLPETAAHDAHLVRRVHRLRNQLARQLERLQEHELALSLYTRSDRPPSRERQVRLLYKIEEFERAWALCHEIHDSPVAEEEQAFAHTMFPKLAKQLDKRWQKPASFRPATSRLTLSPTEERVEFAARTFYGQFGECFYVENSLVCGVLGLFIWDIIFMPVEGVFFNPFQSAPADFYEKEFITHREQALAKRFEELADPIRFSATVWSHYESRQGIANPLVNWSRLDDALLSLALIRIPVEHWRVLFERILLDIRNHASGLPDLILFNKGGGYEFIEIKGPGDAVQKNQRRWMAFFSEQRIPYRVVHIKWANRPAGHENENTPFEEDA